MRYKATRVCITFQFPKPPIGIMNKRSLRSIPEESKVESYRYVRH